MSSNRNESVDLALVCLELIIKFCLYMYMQTNLHKIFQPSTQDEKNLVTKI